MNYKIEGTIRRNKNRFVIFAVLWLFMAIVLVAPIAYAQNKVALGDTNLINEIISAYSNFGTVIRKLWKLHCRFF